MPISQFYYPSEIELVTGFGKEQLRKWRQRFGFPPKESNFSGETAYSLTTVNQLLLIKRLLEAGFRPAQVVGKSIVELEKLKMGIGLNTQAVVAGGVRSAAAEAVGDTTCLELTAKGLRDLLAKEIGISKEVLEALLLQLSMHNAISK